MAIDYTIHRIKLVDKKVYEENIFIMFRKHLHEKIANKITKLSQLAYQPY